MEDAIVSITVKPVANNAPEPVYINSFIVQVTETDDEAETVTNIAVCSTLEGAQEIAEQYRTTNNITAPVVINS